MYMSTGKTSTPRKAVKRKKPIVTAKQKAYVRERLSNPLKPKRRAALDAGYSVYTANRVGRDIETSEGVQLLLETYGLTDELIIDSLKEDIEKKPQNRLGELRLASDIRGLTGKRETNNQINIGIIRDRYEGG